MTLQDLPVEILESIFQHVNIYDVSRIGRVCRPLHKATSRLLREHVVIRLPQTADIDKLHLLGKLTKYKCLQDSIRHDTSVVRQLHLQASKSVSLPCFHPLNSGDMDEETLQLKAKADELAARLVEALSNVQSDSMWEFSWTIGSCIPETVLGSDGYLATHQRALRRISILNNCPNSGSLGCQIDLQPFQHLVDLSWQRIASLADIDTIRKCLVLRAPTLKKLHLGLPRFSNLIVRHVGGVHINTTNPPTAADPAALTNLANGTNIPPPTASRVIFQDVLDVLGIPSFIQQPMYLCLESLTLTSIHLSTSRGPLTCLDALLRSLNWEVLKELRLIRCGGSCQLLERVVALNIAVNLRSLELDLEAGGGHNAVDNHIKRFLLTFCSLQNLALTIPSPLWESVSAGVQNHQPSLETLVVHTLEVPPVRHGTAQAGVLIPLLESKKTVDEGCVDWFGHSILDIIWSKSAGDFVGTSQSPEQIMKHCRNSATRPRCKVLHLRRLGTTMHKHSEAFLRRQDPIFQQTIEAEFQTEFQREKPEALWEKTPDEIRLELLDFAVWAFGPEGLPHLRVIAYGDFTNDNFYAAHNLLLFRDGEHSFGTVLGANRAVDQLLERYRDMLEACPTVL